MERLPSWPGANPRRYPGTRARVLCVCVCVSTPPMRPARGTCQTVIGYAPRRWGGFGKTAAREEPDSTAPSATACSSGAARAPREHRTASHRIKTHREVWAAFSSAVRGWCQRPALAAVRISLTKHNVQILSARPSSRIANYRSLLSSMHRVQYQAPPS